MNENKFINSFRNSIFEAQEKPNVRYFHNQLLKRLEIIEFIVDYRIIFKINDDIINKCSKKLKMELSDVKRIVNYYIRWKLFIKVNRLNEPDTYKIGDSYLMEDEKNRRNNMIWYYIKHGRLEK